MALVQATNEQGTVQYLIRDGRPSRARPTTLKPFPYVRRRLGNALVIACFDGVALSIAMLAAGTLRLLWLGQPLVPTWGWYLIPVWYVGATALHLMPGWGLGPVEELRRVGVLVTFVFCCTATALFLTERTNEVSRLNLTVAMIISLVALPAARLQAKRVLIRIGQWGIPSVVYGSGEAAVQTVRWLLNEKGFGYHPIGVFDDDLGAGVSSVEGIPVLGRSNEYTHSAPVAVLVVPSLGKSRSMDLLEGALSRYRTVVVIPDMFEAPSLWVRTRDLNGILALEITCNLSDPAARLLKRFVDVLVVLATAPFWIPLCAFLAVLIWSQDGTNPLFKQDRVGLHGRPFQTWKFRTMVPDAERVLQQSLASNEALRKEWKTYFKLRKDPRVTQIGAFLRRTSLDELPQLINVLRGEMSLVGPRPLPRYHHDALLSRVRDLRERVRPGITGMWQISGRSDSGTEGMERYDPYYVRNWSPWLDCVILIRTARIVVRATGAY